MLQLGGDLRTARLRRRLSMETVAERAFTSRTTLHRLERGDPSVSIGIYAAVMHALGLLDKLANAAVPREDEVGLARADEDLPKRAYSRKPKRGGPADAG